jgi:hypothetical protein
MVFEETWLKDARYLSLKVKIIKTFSNFSGIYIFFSIREEAVAPVFFSVRQRICSATTLKKTGATASSLTLTD